MKVFPYRLPSPAIVATAGTCGGDPRLDGTRLTVEWFAYHRHESRAWFVEHYPYITDAHLGLMFATVDLVIAANAEEQGPPIEARRWDRKTQPKPGDVFTI